MSTTHASSRSIAEILDHFAGYLARNKQHVARVLYGCAAEGWLNDELRVALNWADPPFLAPGQWAIREVVCRDLVIFDHADRLPSGQRPAAHVIEAKAWYASGAKNMRASCRKLLNQVQRAAMADETEGTRYSGIVFASWDTWQDYGYASPDDFFAHARRVVNEVFADSGVSLRDGGGFCPIMDREKIETAGGPAWVSLAATWVSKAIPRNDIDYPFSETEVEEIKRRMKSGGPYYTTAQVLEYLRSLEGR